MTLCQYQSFYLITYSWVCLDFRVKGRAYAIDVYSDVFTLTIPKEYVWKRFAKKDAVKIVYKNIKVRKRKHGVSIWKLIDVVKGICAKG